MSVLDTVVESIRRFLEKTVSEVGSVDEVTLRNIKEHLLEEMGEEVGYSKRPIRKDARIEAGWRYAFSVIHRMLLSPRKKASPLCKKPPSSGKESITCLASHSVVTHGRLLLMH
jgi:hypothetical protein